MTTFYVTLPFEVRYVDKDDCDELKVPYGSIEILSPDGPRLAFVSNTEQAQVAIRKYIRELGIETFTIHSSKGRRRGDV